MKPTTEQQATAHSPLPWIAGSYDGPFARKITTEDAPRRWLATVVTNSYDGGSKSPEAVATMEANAALIVRAVNSHEALLEALEQALVLPSETSDCWSSAWFEWRDKAVAAIAKANES